MGQPSWDTTCTSPRASQVPGAPSPFTAGSLGSTSALSEEALDRTHTMAKSLPKATSTEPCEVSWGNEWGAPWRSASLHQRGVLPPPPPVAFCSQAQPRSILICCHAAMKAGPWGWLPWQNPQERAALEEQKASWSC